MQRRRFLQSALLGSTALLTGLPVLDSLAAPPKLKITKVRYYAAPGYTKPLFNQARGIVEIQTDGGIVGVGEGGSKDTVEQLAQMIIGENPFRIEDIWQRPLPGHVLPTGSRKTPRAGSH